ncbi:MAG: hypothetical protein QMD77_00965 [Patescibacteria group bacterium]|nr:hypothetical protein [Patescibacteria group bacterium]
MFEKFRFSRKQIERYHKSAKRDMKIAAEAGVPEVRFRFCYDALLKLAMAVCAENGLRVKSRRGHHIELIKKLAFFLKDSEIEILADEMRSKRNWDLYGGGIVISQKEAKGYLDWTKKVFLKAESLMYKKQTRLTLR